MIPTCSSDSIRRRRSKMATWVAGSSEVDRGRPAPESRIIVPVSARAKSTPVTPRSARAASARWRRRAASSWSPGSHGPDREPLGGERGPRGRVRASPASQATTSLADFSRAMASTAAGHVADGLHPMEHPGDPLELLAKALEGLRPALRHLSPHGLRGLHRSRRARRGLRPEAARRLGDLRPDTAEKVRPRGHHARSFHRSRKVRAAMGGRSRVAVHFPKNSGRLLSLPFSHERLLRETTDPGR